MESRWLSGGTDVNSYNPVNWSLLSTRRQEAGSRWQMEYCLYSKLFSLFQLDSYFRHAALSGYQFPILNSPHSHQLSVFKDIFVVQQV